MVDLYELTMAQVYFNCKPRAIASFDLFIRSDTRPFYVVCGIDDVLAQIENFRFSEEDIEYLKNLTLFEERFLRYLQDFRFQGEVWGVKEPAIVFAGEPILRVTANLIEAQIIESFLLNRINLAVTLATKAARVVLSARGRGVYDFSLRRTQGTDAALACAKYSYIVGAKGTSNLLAGSLYKIPVVGTMAHSFVMSFKREIDSFLAFANHFPAKSILLVDTYDVKKGIEASIKVAKFLKRKGFSLLGIRLDSGDLISDAKYARAALDREGLIDTIIFASGNLDEYKIKQLIEAKTPIDAYGVGTNMGCSSDHPFTDVVYKLVEIKERGEDFVPVMKLSEAKTTLPFRKQVFRVFDKGKVMRRDYIGLHNEKIEGQRLLMKLMSKGKRIYQEEGVEEKRRIFLRKLKSLPPSLKKVEVDGRYPVKVSKRLSFLVGELKSQLKQRVAKRCIFLDIDTQYDFLDKKGALYVEGSDKIIENLKRLTEFAKKSNILILSSQDTHKKRDPEFEKFPPHCVKGSRGQKKIKETMLDKYNILSFKKAYSPDKLRDIIKQYPQLILGKNTLNVFSNPNTLPLLEIIFPDEVYVYGVVTEYCVKQAVEGLIRNNFSTFIVEDAVKEISPQEKSKLFSLWKKKGVGFIKTGEVVKELINVKF